MKATRLTVLALLMSAAAAVGQELKQAPPGQPGPVAPPKPAPAAQPMPAQPVAPTTPQFDPIAKKGPDGKVIRVEGVVDILAFDKNEKIDAATREKIKPVILNWLADVDQLAIDNLDFLEKIEPPDDKPGMLDNIDVDDHAQLQQMSQMMSQLMSAGPLSNHLEMKGVLTREQSQLNQQITSDYLQQCMNELMDQYPDLSKDGVDEEKLDDKGKAEHQAKLEAAKKARINNLTKFLYGLSCKDTISSYHRLMADAAPHIDAIVASLNLTGAQASKVRELVPAVKAAKTKTEQKNAVRKLMNELNFDQRRELLTKSQELSPVTDPLVHEWS
jgi:hypothetical protein